MVPFIFIQTDHFIWQVLLLLMLVRNLSGQSVLLWERICSPWQRGTSYLRCTRPHHHCWIPCRRCLSWHLLNILLMICWLLLILVLSLRYHECSGLILVRLISNEIEIIATILILPCHGSCGHCRLRILAVRGVEHGCAALSLLGIGERVVVHVSCHIWKLSNY